MTKYSKEELDQVVLHMLDGMGAAEARHMVGVSHTPAELHVFRFQCLIAGVSPGEGEWAAEPGSAKFNRLVTYLRFHAEDDRGKLGWGIGKIMVMLNATEGQVRKAIREGANVDDRGHRTGKGGRFFEGKAEYYEGELKTEGTRFDLGSDLDRSQQARLQRLMKLDLAELKALAKDMGVTVGKSTTKARLAKAMATA